MGGISTNRFGLSTGGAALGLGGAAGVLDFIGGQDTEVLPDVQEDISAGMANLQVESGWQSPPLWRSFKSQAASFISGLTQRGLNFTQGDIRVVSLDKKPGPEFGSKAHNLGLLSSSHTTRKMTQPGVAVLQTGEASRSDKIEVFRRIVPWLEQAGTPLLLAVRSSPEKSAPGIAKSVIYIGMNETTAQALAKTTSPEVAYRTYVWFIKNFMRAVHPQASIDDGLRQKTNGATWKDYTRLLLDDLGKKGIVIPDDPYEQLLQATDAVANSMSSAGMTGGYVIQRAVVIDDNPLSGAGVYFTRSSSDGGPVGSGRFASRETGSEVVTGDAGVELAAASPLLASLDNVRDPLERLFGEALDVEFAFVRGALYLLQARPMQFSDPGVQIHVWENMVRGGLMAAAQFPRRIFDLKKETPTNVYVVKDPDQLKDPVGRGKGVNRLFAAQGRLVQAADILSKTEAEELRIMFAEDPNDPAVLSAVWKRRMAGIITPSGHEYSHIAILAQALKIPMLIGFGGGASSLIGKVVLLDEVTGALYAMSDDMSGLLTGAPQIDVRNYLKTDPEAIEREVSQEIVGMSIKAMATRHDGLIEEAIDATKRGDFARAAYLTIKANSLHVQLRKLQNVPDPFVVYAWDHQLPTELERKYEGQDLDRIRAALVKEAFDLDPMFRKLSEYYGDRLRLVVTRNPQAGQYLGLMEFYRISAIVEGGSPFLKRWEFSTRSHGDPIERLFRMIFRLGMKPKEIINAREEAKAMAKDIDGAQYVEYDIVDRYHDRGLIAWSKVIGVLPPLLSKFTQPEPAKEPMPVTSVGKERPVSREAPVKSSKGDLFVLDAFLQTSNSREPYIRQVVEKIRRDYGIDKMPHRDVLRQIALAYGITEVLYTGAALGLDGANIVTSTENGKSYIITLRFRRKGLAEFFVAHELGHQILNHKKGYWRENEKEANYFAQQLTGIHPVKAVALAALELPIFIYDAARFLLDKEEQEKMRNL